MTATAQFNEAAAALQGVRAEYEVAKQAMIAASRSQRVVNSSLTSLAGSMPVPPASAADEEDAILREIHERDRAMEELQARRDVFNCLAADWFLWVIGVPPAPKAVGFLTESGTKSPGLLFSEFYVPFSILTFSYGLPAGRAGCCEGQAAAGAGGRGRGGAPGAGEAVSIAAAAVYKRCFRCCCV